MVSIKDPPQQQHAPSGASFGQSHSIQLATRMGQVSLSGSSKDHSVLQAFPSNRSLQSAPPSPAKGLKSGVGELPGPGPSTSGRSATGGAITGAAAARLRASDWSKVTIPPEVAEAQLQHLAAVTEIHLARYHGTVSDAQEQLLIQQGLDPTLLGCDPECLQEMFNKEFEGME